MTFTAFFLVFISVFLHAGWNFISKKNIPSAAFYMLSSFTASAIWIWFAAFGGVNILKLPQKFWLFFLCSDISEVIYCVSLAYGYRVGDMSLVYPMGRALPVILVAVITTILGLGSMLSVWAIAGILLIFIGSLLVPVNNFSEFNIKVYFSRTLMFVLLIAIGTTGYTICDRQIMTVLDALSGIKIWKSLTYTFFVEFGLACSLAVFVAVSKEERKEFKRLFCKSWAPVLTGICSSSAYALVVFAYNFVTNVSYIQAFRQMSLPIGVLAGVVLLKEKCGIAKLSGIILIVLGLVIVNL